MYQTRVLIPVFWLVFVIALGACVGLPTATPSPYPGVPQAVLDAIWDPPGEIAQARVTRVVDGDTVVVEIEGREYRLRYIGMDTPETVHPDRPVEEFGPEASARNRELVEGKIVWLEKDVSETDRFGRLLRYVFLEDGTFVNAKLVEEGLAQVSTFPPDVKYVDLLVQLQREAQAASRGLWAVEDGFPATVARASNLRSGPGINYPFVGFVDAGESISVLSKSADEDWFKVNVPEGTAWIAVFLVTGLPEGTLIPLATTIPPTPTPSPDGRLPVAEGCVDLNTADQEALRLIIHIDEERSGQVLDLRAERPFATVDEIQRVRGIGEARQLDILMQGVACARE